MRDPVTTGDRAPDNLRYIHDRIQPAIPFTSIPGWGTFLIGWTAVGASVVAQRYASGSDPRWVAVWLAEAVVATFIAGVTIELKRRRTGTSLTAGPARRLSVSYFAPIFAAALLTNYLFDAKLLAALPPTWLLLYGAAFVSSGAFSSRIVPAMGGLFMILGVVACFGPLSMGNVLLGAGFGGVHIVCGWVIGRKYGG